MRDQEGARCESAGGDAQPESASAAGSDLRSLALRKRGLARRSGGEQATSSENPDAKSDGPQCDPGKSEAPKSDAPKAVASQQDKTEALTALNAWQTRANAAIVNVARWYSKNHTRFLTRTGTRHTLSWTDSNLFSVLEVVSGLSLSAGASKGSAAVAAATGAGPTLAWAYKTALSLGVKQIASLITTDLKDAGRKQADEQNAVGLKIEESTDRFLTQAASAQGSIAAEHQARTRQLMQTEDLDEVQAFYLAAMRDLEEIKAPDPSDVTLFQRMYHDWALESSSSNDNRKPQTGIDQQQYDDALKTAVVHPEDWYSQFAFQTRGEWAKLGLDVSVANKMIEAAAIPPEPGIRRSAVEPEHTLKNIPKGKFQLGIVDAKLALKGLPLDAANEKDIAAGKVSVACTVHLNSRSTSINVDHWDYEVLAPARGVVDKSDPLDGGRPTGDGEPSLRKLKRSPD